MEPPCCSSRRLVAIVSLVLLGLLLRPAPTMSRSAPEQAPAVGRTITVDQQGGGDFRSVQSAVDSVPDGNREWIRIHVKSGSYREKVKIPKKKNFILLQGDGSWNTDINFDDHAHADVDDLMRNVNGLSWSPTAESATFTVLADDFVARNISFRNLHNAVSKARPDQALAAMVAGDRSAFHGCAFYGFQDTLCDLFGRHYFRDCFIKGGIDFIFGYGQSIYEDCTLVADVPSWYGRQPGWVTAHGRVDAGSPGGMVFKGGEVRGSGRVYLGRAWNEYATVLFYRVNMTDVVVPQGWAAWNSSQDVSHVTFAEVGCTGPGSGTAGRVSWEKHLTGEEVQRYVGMEFIGHGGWLSNLPHL
uniref:Uncharacterized protein n=1 Tax=Avena sativa TaxID=4498 RepID=A0ACD5YYL8_AVESA